MKLSLELAKHIGKWIAIIDNKIVAVRDSGKEVFDEVERLYPDKEPFIMKVPKNENMLLSGMLLSGEKEKKVITLGHLLPTKPPRLELKEIEKLTDEEIDDYVLKVFARLAGRVEFAVDNGREIRNLTEAELEEADRRAADKEE